MMGGGQTSLTASPTPAQLPAQTAGATASTAAASSISNLYNQQIMNSIMPQNNQSVNSGKMPNLNSGIFANNSHEPAWNRNSWLMKNMGVSNGRR